MGDGAREFVGSRTFNTIGTWLAAIAAVPTAIALLNGWITIGAVNNHDNQEFRRELVEQRAQFAQEREQERAQLSNLSNQISDLSKQMPSTYQMQAIQTDLSGLHGRMDGMDTRIQSDERTLTRVQTDVDNIRTSSDAQLRGHVH